MEAQGEEVAVRVRKGRCVSRDWQSADHTVSLKWGQRQMCELPEAAGTWRGSDAWSRPRISLLTWLQSWKGTDFCSFRGGFVSFTAQKQL